MFTQRVNALTGAVEWAAATGAGAAGAAAAVGASSHVRARTGAERRGAYSRERARVRACVAAACL